MIVLQNTAEFPASAQGGVLCVGNFDGVHVGHARMLSTGRDLARRHGIPFSIMTFDPHPNIILRPQTPRAPLMTLAQRRQHLAEFSPDVLMIIPTTREFLATPPESFLADVVQKQIGATHIVEGPTFTFGKGAKGDIAMLQSRGAQFGFSATVVDTVEIVLTDLLRAKVSSSVIRWLVENGRVLDAATALGRPFTLRGPVVEGQKRGRTIGFPTANLQVSQLIPIPGVYAGRAVVDGQPHRAAISVGANVTFNATTPTVEAFLLDFTGDLYGKVIDLEFHRYLREMHRFAGVDPLVRQMNLDVAATRTVPFVPGVSHG